MNHKKILLLVAIIGVLLTVTGFQTSPEYKILFEKAKFTMETKGDLNGAINIFNDIIKKYPKEREYAAKSQLYIGLCFEKLGIAEARKAYERVVREYRDQSEIVAQARARLAVLSSPVNKTEFVTRRILSDASGVGEILTADGKHIRGLDWETGDVYQYEIASGQTSKIANKGTWIDSDKDGWWQALSSDGKQIAYNSNTKDWIPRLQIRNLDGSEVRTLYCEKDYYVYPYDWSPDAGSILALRGQYSHGSELIKNELILVSTPDGSIRVLRNIPAQIFMFERTEFSPDGQYIAFSYVRDGNPPHGDIFLMTADGRNEIIVAGHPSEDRFVGWAPDSKSLIFLSDRSGTWDIWTVPISGGKQQGEPELLKKDFGYYSEFIGIAPDGSFYYRTNTHVGGLFSGAIDLETGKVLVSPSPVATRYTGPPYQPSWSPDGKYLLYRSRVGSIGPGNNILTIRSEATGEERFLSPPLRFVNQISWAPDGRSILAIGITETERGIYKIDAETSAITKLTGENHYEPRLSPDGKTLVFVKPGPVITKLNLETGEESKIAETLTLSYDISPDGRQVVFQRDSTVKTISINGGEPKEMIRGLAKFYGLKWTYDGRYIIVRAIADKANENSKIWRIPSQGGTPLKLDLSVPDIRFFALNPDNRRFVFSVSGETKSELWVMENFLPKKKMEENNQLTLKKLDYAELNTPFARLSPDGKKMAYLVYVENSPKRIEILDLSSGNAKAFIESGVGGQSFVWSPKNDKIAYSFNGKELHVRDINGANSQIIYKSPEYTISPTDWSTDGKKILCFFEAADRTLRIGTVTSDGQIQFLVSGNSIDFRSEAKISPDGAYVACSLGENGGNTDIYVWTSDGSRKERVTEQPGRDENPVWSPDGKYLTFLSDRNRSVDLWGVQMKDGATVGAPFVIKRDLGWRTRIYDITASGKLSLLMVGGAEPANLFTIPVDQESGSLSGTIAPISIYPTDHFFPKYSPNGEMIAYISRKGQIGFPKLFVLDKKGAERELLLQGHYVTNVAWHPDNRSLFFAGMDKTFKAGVYELSLEKNEIRSVYSGESIDMGTFKDALININMMPEAGKIMFFRILEKGYVNVITCEPDGQNLTVVLPRVKMPIWGLPSPNGENICYPVGDSLMVISVSNGAAKLIGSSTPDLQATWSPHGESLMYKEGSRLRIFSLKENTSRTVYQAPNGKTICGMEMYANSWSPDGSRFIITERDTSVTLTSPQKLIMINLSNGSPNVLGEAPEGYPLSELRWSPDGSKVIATGKSISSASALYYEYWVMENFLPK